MKKIKILQFTLPFQKDNKLLSRDKVVSFLPCPFHQHTLPQKHLVFSKYCSLNFNSLAFCGKPDSEVPYQRNITVIAPPTVSISRFTSNPWSYLQADFLSECTRRSLNGNHTAYLSACLFLEF